jgi:tRNA nucleotidyltransferase (CCA-adding enzyme)
MNIKQILSEQVKMISLDKKTLMKIMKVSENFVSYLKKMLKDRKISAEVFIGGSLAKDTLVKKEKYDIDIFVRFERKYGDKKISGILGEVLGEKAKKIHGSRDYYSMLIDDITFEVIPVLKINKSEQALNITDLSYFHVSYVLEKIRKNKNLSDEIKLAKAFVHAQNCYGAESYVHGFSGYAIELLICHYGSFLKFVMEIAGSDSRKKIVIDDKKFYKGSADIIIELNESKLQSPIILIDPTYHERNALASLRQSTFEKFKESCKEFLANPSSDFFERKNIFKELNAEHKNLRVLSVKTTKQEGDIAGTKSRKFFEFFSSRLSREFSVRKGEFDYDEKKNSADFYFVLGKKKDEAIRGPSITDTENITRFKKAHPDAFIRKQFAYAKKTHNLTFERFLEVFLKKEKKVLQDMSIKEMKLIR